MAKKNKNKPIYKLSDGSVPAIITSHLSKKGKLRCDDKKQEKVLRGACVHHKLNGNGKIKATISSNGKGERYCRICGAVFSTTPFSDEALSEVLNDMENLNNQAKFVVTAVGADNSSQRFFAETGSILKLYPKAYKKLIKVAKKADSVKKKKKKNRSDATSTYGSWR